MKRNIPLILLLSLGTPVALRAQEPSVPFVPLLWRTNIAEHGGVTQPDYSIETIRLALIQLEALQKANLGERTTSQQNRINVVLGVLRSNERQLETFYAKSK